MKHIVMFSGGIGSYMAAKRVVAEFGTRDTILLFADTNMEDEDLYRFIDDAASVLGVPVTRIADGRTPWEVFHDRRYLGNSRVDPCSDILKRALIDRWIKARYQPDECIVYVGIDWNESHHIERPAPRKLPYIYKAPMCEPPLLLKEEMLRELVRDGVEIPRLYRMGFSHNNCGGFCVKAGQGHFIRLLELMPERYAHHEAQEAALQQHIGKLVTILKRVRKRQLEHISLRQLREEHEAGQKHDVTDVGGCGCALE